MKKFLLCLLIVLLCFISATVGAAFGGSNMSYYYPDFNEYLSYDPTRTEIERYIESAKDYVENCNSDIQLIRDAQNNAIREANAAVSRYNNGY